MQLTHRTRPETSAVPFIGGRQPRLHTAVLSNGLALPYVEHGDRSGRPVILLHGYTDSWRSFEPVLPHLGDEIRAIAFTQRGHGHASRPAGGYRPQDFADDLAGFMDALGIGTAVVVGHSMGSYVAQRFAIDHPDRVTGLVLAGSFATARGNTAIRELWDEGVADLQNPISPSFARAFQESTLAQPVPPAFLTMVVQESLKTPARVWRAALAGLMEADHSAQLGRIAAPTLVVWGARDSVFTRSDQDAVLAAIPQARLLVYGNAGHGLHWEEPERFAVDVAAFAAAVRRRT